MPEPDWTEVLDVMYEELFTIESLETSEEGLRLTDDPESDDVAYLSDTTGQSVDELTDTIREMQSVGLVESIQVGTEPRMSATIGLTETGFNVAHQRAQTQQQDRTNTALVIFTLVLAVSAAIQASTAFLGVPPELPVPLVVILVILAGGLLAVLYRFVIM